MKELCKTCNGKGTINDPNAGSNMNYSGPNGETAPQVICPCCGGSGIQEE